MLLVIASLISARHPFVLISLPLLLVAVRTGVLGTALCNALMIATRVAISDLRPVRSEHYLHHDATVRNGLVELAIRIETLIITSNKLALRPPRKLVFALALYLWELEPKAVAPPDEASEEVMAIEAAA